MAKENILLIKMFAGGFNVDNIGHEIINYYLPDNSDEYHIFVPHNGNVDPKKTIGPILLLEKTNISYVLKVIAVIKQHKLDDDDLSTVFYDTKSLSKITFSKEDLEAKYESFNRSTFKCHKNDYYKTRDLNLYVIPINKDGGTFSEEKRRHSIDRFNNEIKNNNPQAALIELNDKKPWHNISYIPDNTKDYKLITNEIIEKATDNTRHESANSKLNDSDYEQDNLLNYIDKEYDENAITSFFCSLLNEKKLLAKEFVKSITGDDSDIISIEKQKLALTENQQNINRYINASKHNYSSQEDYKKKIDEAKRKGSLLSYEKDKFDEFNKDKKGTNPFEKGLIDLFVETQKSVIVIENKIKSDLNGKSINGDDEEVTQLSKYDKYLSLISGNKNRYLFVFSPDYNCDFLIDEKIDAIFEKKKYSELYKFFSEKLKDEIVGGGVWENKYRLFLNTLKKHSIRLEDEMLIRFKKAIQQCD